ALGAAALLLERSGVSIAHARRIGWMVALVSAACLITSAILRAAADPAILYVVNAQVAVVILIALAALPLKPVHVLALGVLTEVFYVAATRLAIWKWGFIEPPSADVNLVFLAMLSVMSTAVAVNSYRRLLETHQSHQAQLRTAEEMRDAQCQVLMSDSAASMGRLAAALSHELNNPLGALRSSVDTLRSLSARDDLPPEKRAGLERRLYETAGESVDRIHGIVRRIQRYTHLDRAEEMPVDLNPLVSDVAEIVREAMEGKVRFELETEPLPDVQGRPQALSAVFSGLLGDAARAAGDGGGVRVKTAARDG
ncbi:MAG: HAMP domain-containing histidine kinase, partial [bacterium]|nr:HAMP domain-containing histidine kinase [bacterium]